MGALAVPARSRAGWSTSVVPFARLVPKPGRNISVITGTPLLATQRRNPSENPTDSSAREVAVRFWPFSDHILHHASSSFSTVSDVTFVVGREKQQVFAHRCVLACRCQAFRGMLTSNEDPLSSVPPQGPFILGNVQPEVFLAVIEFLYTNSGILSIMGMVVGSPALPTHSLSFTLQLCVEFIKDTLCVEQVCEALQVSVVHSQAVLQTRGFHELSDTVLARVLRSDHLAADELDLVQAVREWAHVSSAVLERPVPEVAALPVQELRLPLLAPNELAMLESQNQHDLLIPVDSIAAAWRSHALRCGSGMPSHLCRPRQGTRPRNHHRHLDPQSK
uniref:BTB domain containing 19 n=1 Tax=Phasianus colchicus TaxID=9054 RepID=A0A669PG62_PHACC